MFAVYLVILLLPMLLALSCVFKKRESNLLLHSAYLIWPDSLAYKSLISI